MKKIAFLLFIILFGCVANAQKNTPNKKDVQALKHLFKANNLVEKDKFIEAETNYRIALSQSPNIVIGAYNLAHSYYKEGNFNEALFRAQEAVKNAKTKEEKHKAFHNTGNILMQNKQCKQATEAFKNALRNNPNDDETRYNFALAKQCAEEQEKDGDGEDDKKDKNKEDKEDKQKKEKDKNQKKEEDKGNKDKKEGEDEEDEKGKPKEDKKDKGKGEEKDPKNEKKKPEGQISPQQIKNILEAMQNQEQKVQQKINDKKQKSDKFKTDKDW